MAQSVWQLYNQQRGITGMSMPSRQVLLHWQARPGLGTPSCALIAPATQSVSAQREARLATPGACRRRVCPFSARSKRLWDIVKREQLEKHRPAEVQAIWQEVSDGRQGTPGWCLCHGGARVGGALLRHGCSSVGRLHVPAASANAQPLCHSLPRRVVQFHADPAKQRVSTTLSGPQYLKFAENAGSRWAPAQAY